MTVELIDELEHKSYLLMLDGKSYRIKNSLNIVVQKTILNFFIELLVRKTLQ